MNDVESTLVNEASEAVEKNIEDSLEVEDATDSNSEISMLKAELEELRAELKAREEREKTHSRILEELEEFGEYFPEIDIHQIPEEVWEKVKSGVSLSASFALNLRKMELEKKKVSDFNEKNRRMSAGSLMRNDAEKYYSPSEVKKMTPAQVKSHYDEIVASMRHWN